MRSLAFSGVALAALVVSQPVSAHIDSGVGAPPPPAMMGDPDNRRPVPPPPPPESMLGDPDNRMNMPTPLPARMRHMAGRRLDYQRPAYGFQLPPQWMTAANYVDYREFGLDRPARGFGWSRYYNDMVLTDQWGRVYDVADDYDREQSRRDRGRDTDGIVGGVAGAAVGAVAGNVIAGAGSRLAGSLIGGGVGALAGLAVELAISKKHRHSGHHEERWSGGGEFRTSGHAHWGGYPAQGGSYCNCGSGGETITTTTVTHHGGGYMVPRQVVSYDYVEVAAPAKYRARAAAPSKYRVREAAPVADGKTRVRLHTKTY